MQSMARRYEMKRRAERQDDTRRRIVEATIALHAEVGTSASITSIAERAGVSRLTVYRHFPDERSLLSACTGTYFEANPPPDPTAWAWTIDPVDRLRTGLGELYAFYRRHAVLLGRGEDESPTNPILAEVMTPFVAAVAQIGDVLAAGWAPETSGPSLVSAAIHHAVAFSTWRSLALAQGLGDADAVVLMAALVSGAEVIGSRTRQFAGMERSA
jgi:AcrR family transcriptional regulator